MENIIALASLALYFLLVAFVITALVSLGSLVLGRSSQRSFWSMYGVTCVILLVLNVLALMSRLE